MPEPTLRFSVGDEISYLQVTRSRDYSFYPVMTNYTTTRIRGKVIRIRDLEVEKLNYSTVRQAPERERSQYLVTVLFGNKIHTTYHGCMVAVRRFRPPAPAAPQVLQWNSDVLFDLHPSSKVCCR